MIAMGPLETGKDELPSHEGESEVLMPKGAEAAKSPLSVIPCGNGSRVVAAQALWLALSVILFSGGLLAVSFFPPTHDCSPAATEEDLAYQKCSNHGIYDTLGSTCLCFDCFEGDSCETAIPANSTDCVIDAAGGNPNIFEEYWVAHPEAGLTILPSEHIGYGDKLGCDKLALENGGFRVPESIALESRCDLLAEAIRQLHKEVGNADADEWHIVPGVGSSELIDAALFAWGRELQSQDTIRVTSKPPYYNGYPSAVSFFQGLAKFEWVQAEDLGASGQGHQAIEFITSPNNPDGVIRSQSVPNSLPVFDFAYQWPHFTGVSKSLLDQVASSNGIALFTLSKVSGHAGTRIGWAMTQSQSLAESVHDYVGTSGAIPRESQHRALKILKHMSTTDYEILRLARREMQSRWEQLTDIFKDSKCFSVQARGAAVLDEYTKETALPSPAYLWLSCPSFGVGSTCFDFFLSRGVKGKPGELFGAETGKYVRFQLLMRGQTFEILAEKLRSLDLNDCP